MKKYVIISAIVIIIILLSFNIIKNKEKIEIVAENNKMNLISQEESENIISDTKNDIENENIITDINNEVENQNITKESSIQNDEETLIKNQDNIVDTQEENVLDVRENQDSVTVESEVEYIEGFEIVGYLKIPKYNVNAPIFRNVTKRTLEISIAVAFGNLNEIGNTTIYGHAYKDYPFEKISELENGDTIIIKDSSKREITYEVYDKQIINSQDATYMMRNTNGAREISMQTGAQNNTKLIVLAREV